MTTSALAVMGAAIFLVLLMGYMGVKTYQQRGKIKREWERKRRRR